MTKVAFIKKTFFANKLDLNIIKKLVKCYVSIIVLYGDEAWTVRKLDKK
jgi:hypothetical protein